MFSTPAISTPIKTHQFWQQPRTLQPKSPQMREKTRYRISVFWDLCLFLFIGLFAAVITHLEFWNIWFDIFWIIVFAIVGIVSIFSPKFRRYMRKQAVGIKGIPEGKVVGKYTILEDEFEQIREACANEVCKQHLSVSLSEWLGFRWEAIKDQNTPEIACALIPGMFRDITAEEKINRATGASGEFCVGACVVAFWNGFEWELTSWFIPGDEFEAQPALNDIMNSNN